MFPQINIHGDGALNFKTISQFLHHCSQSKNLKSIQQFYAHVIRTELFFVSPNLQSDLALAYTSCIDNNHHTILTRFLKSLNLRNPMPFNSIISHFSQHGSDCFALHTFLFMHRNSVYVDSYALCTSLKSASCLKNGVFGKLVHCYVEKSGWLGSVFVGSALVDFYAKMCSVSDAAKVFDEIPERNTVCANALLSGYAEAKMWGEGIELVRRMPRLSLEADHFTFSAALRACSGLCAVELGREVHAGVVRRVNDVGADVFLQSLLIEMYGRCGLVDNAKGVFSMAGYDVRIRRRDVVLWTSMLGVYGRTGDYAEVIRLFKDMLMEEGIRPDGVAFLTVISACSHTGQVDLGVGYFESMTRDYGLSASREHYSCLVDLLCRAGELERAWGIVSELPHAADCAISLWGALLSACNECGNVGLGKLAAQKALEVEPNNVGIYVLLSNMYAKNGMWDEIEQLREVMKRRGLKKDIAWSLIER